MFDRFATTFPYPIACAVRRLENATEETERYLCLSLLVEVTIRYLAVIHLAHYLRDETRIETIQEQMAGLARPSMGQWQSLLGVISKHYHRRASPPVPGLDVALETKPRHRGDADPILDGMRHIATFVGDPRSRADRASLRDFLELFVAFRNRTSGHGVGLLTPTFCRQHVEHIAPAMAAVLHRLEPICRYPLRQIGDVRFEKDRAVHIVFDWTGLAHRKVESWTSDPADRMREHRLYLWGESGPTLSLSPFFVASEDELYLLDLVGESELAFVGCRTWRPSRQPMSTSVAAIRLAEACTDPHRKAGDTELRVFVPPPDVVDDAGAVGTTTIQSAPRPDEAPARPAVLGASLDDEGRQTLAFALAEAERLGHELLPAHLLIALTRIPRVAAALQRAGTSPTALRSELRKLLPLSQPGWQELDAESLRHEYVARLRAADEIRSPIMGTAAREIVEAMRTAADDPLARVAQGLEADNRLGEVARCLWQALRSTRGKRLVPPDLRKPRST